MKNLKETVFESGDTLDSVVSMLWLVEKTISEVEHQGEEVAVKGASAVLFSVIASLSEMQKEFEKSLKGGF